MSMTAKPGEFEISDEVSQRTVASNRRASASTFCPNSSQSRSGITDSGQRYEVRLSGARVQLRRPGEPWRNLVPLDPTDPFGMSMHDSREGDRIDTPIRFDMVAASRGRLLAKEEGTDRFFSLIIDPLFRTSQKTLPNGSVTTTSADGGDPVVPSNYLKLDPEFFLPSADAIAPQDLKAHYQHHPAGDRFPLFVRALEAQLTDMWVVLPKPRVWYLVDARSPLKVFDFDDLFCFSDEDARAAFTKARVKAILVEGLHGFYRDEDLMAVAQTAASQIADRVVPNVVSDQISDRLRNIRAAARAIRSFVRGLEGIPGVGSILRNVRRTVTAILDGLDGFAAAVRSAVRARINTLAEEILDIFVAVAAEVLAARIRSEVQAHGFAALLRPALLIGTFVGGELHGRGVIAPVDYGSGRAPTPQRLRCGGSRKALGINMKRLGTFLDAQSNLAVGRLVDAIIDVGRRRRGIGDASAPPAELPTYRHVEYQERRASGPRKYARHSIEFSKVMDLGVGTVHWSEQWHQGFGGELQALWSRRRYLAQEVVGMTVYRFMNGPVVDGDGWQDGTTNFYALVKIPPGPKESTRKFAVIYLDEQTYFTLRWRLVHPFKDVAGDAISISRQLRDNPENFNFDASTYWDPFEAGNITDYSRMGVSRQIIAVTGMDAQTSEPELYTYCFAFGISDHTWRWRRFPSDNVGSLPEPVVSSSAALPESPGEGRLYQNTLAIREDGSLHVRGWKIIAPGGPPVQGRWYQKYLPADCSHAPLKHELAPGKPARGYSHPWAFVAETAFRSMDAFYVLGAYERRVDSRCQYYAVDLRDAVAGAFGVPQLEAERWANAGSNRLRIDTQHLNLELKEDNDGYVPIPDLLRDHSAGLSMYERVARFRLRKRGPLGWIAVYDDKRDDDLQAASHLPCEVTFSIREGERGRKLRLLVRSHQRVVKPPAVQIVELRPLLVNGAIDALQIDFWALLGVEESYENLWRISIGTPDQLVFSSIIHSTFVREAVPAKPRPMIVTEAGVKTPEYHFSYVYRGFDGATAQLILLACRGEALATLGTSVWFENVVGMLATPDEVRILGE